MSQFVEAGHLGGYVPGGDEATRYPTLWSVLALQMRCWRVLDVGCGDGQALQHFRYLGCDVLGIEGVPQDDPDIVQHDYTTGPFVPEGEWDLAWCCEFVEHVEERYVPNFLATFQSARLVLMTHAEPGQAGYHHVNCQPGVYWIARMAEAGFVLDRGLTTLTRACAADNGSPWNHYLRSGLAFRAT